MTTDSNNSTEVSHVTHIPATDSTAAVTLVGVVHHHPASSLRVRRLLQRVQPDVVALELPSLAVPLAVNRAGDFHDSPGDGSEMSAAVAASGEARIVGIDAPNLDYCLELFRQYDREDDSVSLVRDLVVHTLESITRAVSWRIAAVAESRLGMSCPQGRSDTHGLDHDEPDERLLKNESRHIAMSRTFQNAVTEPRSVRLVDTVRERAMANRLRELREHGEVVAVVGLSHLTSITEQLHS